MTVYVPDPNITTMPLIYVAGPFRGANAWEVEKNIRVIEDLGFEIATLGAVPLMPHPMTRFFDGTMTDQFWIDVTLDLMRRCDAICVARHWEESVGTKGEIEEAKRLGMPLFFEEKSGWPGALNAWIKEWKEQK